MHRAEPIEMQWDIKSILMELEMKQKQNQNKNAVAKLWKLLVPWVHFVHLVKAKSKARVCFKCFTSKVPCMHRRRIVMLLWQDEGKTHICMYGMHGNCGNFENNKLFIYYKLYNYSPKPTIFKINNVLKSVFSKVGNSICTHRALFKSC